MTAFWIAAFCFALALLAGRPSVWSLAHVPPGVFLAGTVVFSLLGSLQVFAGRLPFARRFTSPRIATLLTREAPLAILWRAPIAWLVLPVVALTAALLLHALRMRLFLPPPEGLGDSLLLLEHVPVYTRVFGYLDSFDELLALYFRSRFYLMGAEWFGWAVHDSYAVLSSALGGLYVLLVLFFLRGRSYFALLAGLALFLFVPALQLYAGYVENYSLASLLLSAALFLCGRALEAEAHGRSIPTRTIAILAGIAAFGVLVHGVVAFVGPALIYFTLHAARGDTRRFLRLAVRAGVVALGILLPVWIYFFFFATNQVDFFESFAYRPALYPPGRWFSLEHLHGLVNLPLLAAPTALLLLVLWPALAPRIQQAWPASAAKAGWRRRWDRLLPDPASRFFLLATLGFAGHAFVWNPLIGFPADWDLFTFFQAPLHCFVFYRLVLGLERTAQQSPPERSPLFVVLCGLLFVALASTGFWLARNAQSSPTSQTNLQRAERNAAGFLTEIREDPRFERLPTARRRKQYVKALLFVLRSREVLEQHPGPEATRLAAALEPAWNECARVLTLDESAYRSEFPAAWQTLTRVNIELEAWKNKNNIK